jgi:DNA-binding CsgD family transcriptional regulator
LDFWFLRFWFFVCQCRTKMPRPEVDLEQLKDQILDLQRSGASSSAILNFVRSKGVQISQRTLQRRILGWGASEGVSYNLEQYEEDILEWWSQGQTNEQIIQSLAVRHNIQISLSTLTRYLRRAELQRYHEVSDEALQLVRFYFLQYGFKDTSILRELAKRKIHMSKRMLQSLRLQSGLKRRYRTTEEREQALQIAKDFIEQDLQSTSVIRGFGRQYLYHYVRFQAGVLVGKNLLYEHYKERFPDLVYQRRLGNWRHRTDFKVPGPNFLWALDGYEKLKVFGFQIYACIDAYSRAIIWIYVGPSATTSISTLKQFLRTISESGVRPFFTRSDHGKETPLWVSAQATLAEAAQTVVSYEDEDGNVHIHRQGDRIESCHIWATSTRNVRIESWFRRLRNGATDRWIVSPIVRDKLESYETNNTFRYLVVNLSTVAFLAQVI